MARNHSASGHRSEYWTNSLDDTYASGMYDSFMQLGFSSDVTKWLVQQGLKRPEKLCCQTNEAIDCYIWTCCKPGGGEKGFVCSMDVVALLKQTVWGVKHMDRVDILEHWCHDWSNQIDPKKNWDNEVKTKEYPKVNQAKEPGKFFEDLETLLSCIRGVTGVPLLQVVRKNLLPKDENEDPHTGKPDSKYLTIDDEMIACGPIIIEDNMELACEEEDWEKDNTFDLAFLQDCKKVWTILSMICQGIYLYVHIKQFRGTIDSRGAWFSLKDFLLGVDQVLRTIRELESTLRGLTYCGEGWRHNFAKYCTAYTEQDNTADGLMEHGYPGLSMDQRIQYFLDGIKTSALESGQGDCPRHP